mmetsp:Transcript_11333/g.19093  ORF Transcript_11333/g.19093 Transcript_11333/m.19093 type:complete len:113 (+) Transcript_11333:931-1269(+)
MLDLVEKTFESKSEYTPQKIMSKFGSSDPFKIVQDVPYVNEVQTRNASFDIYLRAKHVLSEAKRVFEFRDLCNDESIDDEAKILKLGQLMNDSHASCRDNYDCSSDQLEELT